MAEIKIDLSRAYSQAEKLSSAANSLRQEAEKLSDEAQNISSYWESEAADIFKAKVKEKKNELISCCKQLEDIADDIRVVAKRIKAQEEAAKKAAQNL